MSTSARHIVATVLVVVVVVVLAVALAVVILRAGVLMTNDGPQHVLASMARAAAHSDEPFTHVVGASEAVTDLGFHELFQLFAPSLGWERAYAATLVVLAETWAFGFALFVWAFAPQRRVLGLLGFPTALSLTFYLGVLPFQLSLAFGLFVLAAHVQVKSDALRTVVTAVALFAMARAHVLPAVLIGAVLVVLTIVDGVDVKRRLALVVLSGVPAASIVVVVAGVVSNGDLLPASRPPPVWWPLDARLLHSFLPGPGGRGAIVLGLALVGVLSALYTGTRRERALAVLAVLFISLSCVLPRDLIGWELAAPRFAPLGFVFALALLPVERARTRAVALAVPVAVALLCCAGLAWGAWLHGEQRSRCAPSLALVHDSAPDPRLLSQVILDVQCGMPALAPNVTPLVHLASLYAVDRRTLGEFAHAKSARAHPIVGDPRRYDGLSFVDPSLWLTAAALPPDERAQRVRVLARAYAHRPVVLLQGTSTDLDEWVRLGWRPERRADVVMIAAFVGCTAAVSAPQAARLAIGAAGDDVAWRTVDVAASSEPLVVEHLPCGDIWIARTGENGEAQGDARDAAPCVRGALIAGETRAFTCP